jgi:hypothetical protein
VPAAILCGYDMRYVMAHNISISTAHERKAFYACSSCVDIFDENGALL